MSLLYSEMAALAGLARSLHARGFTDDSLGQAQALPPVQGGAETESMVNAFESLKKRFDGKQGAGSTPQGVQTALPGGVASPGRELHPIMPEVLSHIVTMDRQEGMEALAKEIKSCEKCSRCKTRQKAVPGQGNPQANIMILTESPSADDDQLGLPLTGSAGDFLDKWLQAIGLSRYSNAWLGTIIKCRDNHSSSDSTATELAQTLEACTPYLASQISLRKPIAILALGQGAADWFARRPVDMAAEHGLVLDWHGIPVTCTWHPSLVLRNEDLKRPVWQDLKNFKARLTTGLA